MVNATLSASSYFSNEETGMVEVCVALAGETDREITIQLFTEDDSAISKYFCLLMKVLISLL